MRMRACAGVAAFALALLVPGGAGAHSANAPDCGSPIAKSDGTTWQCTFADYFDGTSLNTTNWSPLTTKRTNLGAPACLVEDNISVRDGLLHLTIQKEPAPFLCEMIVGGYPTQYTAGGVYSANKFFQTYGRFETRAAFPAAKQPGAYSAIWMWPQGGKKKYGDDNGEIDTAEFWTARPDVVKPYVHYNNEDDDPTVTRNCPISHPEDFHTYTVEWTEQTITFIYDGEVCLVNHWNPAAPLEKPAPFDEPFFMTINTALGGQGRHALTAPLPQTMKIDYVKVWGAT